MRWMAAVAMLGLQACVGGDPGVPPMPEAEPPPPVSTTLSAGQTAELAGDIARDPSLQEACGEGMMGKCP